MNTLTILETEECLWLFYLQGPALYAYNDATFRQQDWRGIRMLQDSVKKSDALTVGRFGLGFKSVFHLTGIFFITSEAGGSQSLYIILNLVKIKNVFGYVFVFTLVFLFSCQI